MREHGAYNNPSDMELGQIYSVSPMRVFVGGALITRDIRKLEGIEFSEGDVVAVKRLRDVNLIIGKVAGE